MKKMFMLFFAVLMLLTLPSINQAQTNEEEYEFVQMVKNPDPPPEWILVPRVLSVSEQGTDWVKSRQTSREEEIDYASLWKGMSDMEQRMLILGIRAGILVPLMMLSDLQTTSEQDRNIWVEAIAKAAGELLSLGIFSVKESMISLNELKLRIEIFYLQEPNRYETFEKAVYESIMEAARK